MQYASTLYKGRFYVVADGLDWKEAREAGRKVLALLGNDYTLPVTGVHVSQFRPTDSGSLSELEAALPRKGNNESTQT